MIPKHISKGKPENQVEELCLNHDWTYRQSIHWAAPRPALINALIYWLRPGPSNPWVIPERYQEGIHLEHQECYLIRLNYLNYILTNALLGPMAAQTVRDYYGDNRLEWRCFHNYQAEMEAELIEAGLHLIRAI
jgi:hypothetical protein